MSEQGCYVNARSSYDPASRIASMQLVPGTNGVVLAWHGTSNRTYELEMRTNAFGSFQSLGTSQCSSATATMCATDSAAHVGGFLMYRLKLTR